MKIEVNCENCRISNHYLETLVLLYLPCEKFSQDSEGELSLSVHMADGRIRGHMRLFYNGEKHEMSDEKNISYYPSCIGDIPKVFVGRLFLELFGKVFSYFPPWGMMTGVRPARFAFDFLKKGLTERECSEIFEKYYLVSREKGELALKVAAVDKALIENMEKNECSLYISVPFCPTKCRYCSFVSYATEGLHRLLPDYLEKLMSELLQVSRLIKTYGARLRTVYVGGGTPTVFDADEIKALLSFLSLRFPMDDVLEFTFEAGRPDTLSKEKLLLLKDFGVSRISINTQSTNDKVLSEIGRNHTYSDFLRAFYLARDTGFENINTDLIAGLPGENYESFAKSLDDVISVSPENITVHSFSLKKSSDFTVTGERFSHLESPVGKMIGYSSQRLKEKGYMPYYLYRQKNTQGNFENVGYCRDEIPGLYNIYMMEELHTVFSAGAGCSAMLVSKDDGRVKKLYNPKYPYEYLRNESYITKYKEDIEEFFL